jgi:hypothetical protein
MSVKRVYWLTIDKQTEHENKAALLEDRGYKVEFFKTLDSLTKALRNQRVTILVVGDEGPETIISKAVTLLRHMPDIQGARLILSVSKFSQAILRLAASEGFRDMLPLELEDAVWLQRFEFSTGGQPTAFSHGGFEHNLQKSGLIAIPARAVWLTPNRIWIESRVATDIGTRLRLTGPLAQSMGQKSIPIEIQRLYQDNLFYRFSEALVGSWDTGDSDSSLIGDTMELLKNLDTGRRCKAFLAIQSPALRTALLSYLPQDKFEVHSALQKRSVVEEPKYFSPDLVFIEDRFCKGAFLERFRTMEQNLPKHCAIVVVGSQRNQQETLQSKRRIHYLTRIPKNLDEVLLRQVLDYNKLPSLADPGALFIPSDHEFSLAELGVEAEIQKWGRAGLTFVTRNHIGNFALARVQCQEIEQEFGTAPYIKLTDVRPHPEFKDRFVVEAQFCAMPQRTRPPQSSQSDAPQAKPEIARETVAKPAEVTTSVPIDVEPASKHPPAVATRAQPTAATDITEPDVEAGMYVVSLIALSAAVSLVVSILVMSL